MLDLSSAMKKGDEHGQFHTYRVSTKAQEETVFKVV